MDLSTLSNEQREALLAEAEAELCRQSFMAYCKRMFPDYDTEARHIKLLVEHLERLERGEIKNLMVIMPPRHGKTITVSQLFPSWVAGRHAKDEQIMVSYNATRIEESSIKVRDYMESPLYPFPDVKVRQDARAVNLFRTTAGGKILATGVDGSLTGAGYTWGFLDDVQKDADDVGTMEKSDNLLKWYDEVFSTRAYPNARTLVINTLWSQRDMAYRIIEREPEAWTVLHVAAICDNETTDPLGRNLGEALWPTQRPIQFLERIKKSIGTRAFSALYQGRPLAAEGNLIKSEWLAHEYDALPSIEYTVPSERKAWWSLMPGGLQTVKRPLEVIQYVDSSWGTANGDFSVIATVGTDYKALYIMDIARGRWDHVTLTKMVEAKYNQYRPRVVCVEAAQSGFAVIQSLKSLNRIPILAIPPRGSKIGRIESITPLMEAGQVLWPREAPWKKQAQEECLLVPNGTFDDVPDALAGAISSLWAHVKLQPAATGGSIGRASQFELVQRGL